MDTVFSHVKKKGVRFIKLTRLIPCDPSRSNCHRTTGTLSLEGVLHPVFVKLSPCMVLNRRTFGPTSFESRAKKSSAYVETSMFKITNRLNTRNVCRSFVYCYNSRALSNSLFKLNNVVYSMLITDDISDFIPLHAFIKFASDYDIASVLFQIIYTLSCMNTIRLTHTDFHFGNIFVQSRPKLTEFADKYTYNKKSTYFTTRVPCDYQLKIIDLDGAHKHAITGYRLIKIVDKYFVKGVTNKFHKWGNTKTNNARFDIIKLIFHLNNIKGKQLRSRMHNILKRMGITNSKNNVPFFDFNISCDFPARNVNGANRFGMFFDKRGNFLALTDDHIIRPKHMLDSGKPGDLFVDVKRKTNDDFNQKYLLRC